MRLQIVSQDRGGKRYAYHSFDASSDQANDMPWMQEQIAERVNGRAAINPKNDEVIRVYGSVGLKWAAIARPCSSGALVVGAVMRARLPLGDVYRLLSERMFGDTYVRSYDAGEVLLSGVHSALLQVVACDGVSAICLRLDTHTEISSVEWAHLVSA